MENSYRVIQELELDPRTHDYIDIGWMEYEVNASLHDKFLELVMQMREPVIWDIGAHVGIFTLLALQNPGARVVACEPNAQIYSILQSNVQLNGGTDRVAFVQQAIYDRCSNDVSLYVPTDPYLSGFATIGTPLRVDRNFVDKVSSTTIDNLFELFRGTKFTPPTILKIDVEGAELQVLQGGITTIYTHHPQILVECCTRNTLQCGYEREEIIDWLDHTGYASLWITDNDVWAP